MIPRTLAAEGLGTAMLLIGVVGSGIMADTLSGGNVALALLGNAVATGCMLVTIITVLGPISGAHFNPAVTLAFYLQGGIGRRDAVLYTLVQIAGGLIGVWATHFMFDLPIFETAATMHRTGPSQWFSELLATLGLLFVIFGGLRARPDAVPALVGLYITGAYFFTSSTSFANPAVTIARSFTDTFAGISPGHAPMFIVMQISAVFLGYLTLRPLFDD
ncbi:aquaporin [Chachezhania sediminis]|uniref:aquaporin n=1 Tax=Chachezhania sediminis TaxID=2599291 RepID=UPI00131C7D7E|nr:MIP/aquaporin family protein [Chachezhania sediminis]